MKNLIFITLALSGISYTAYTILQDKNPPGSFIQEETYHLVRKSPICLVFYQDVSGSITENGVELVSSSIFTPYYNDIDRDIEFYFGVIDDLTAQKLIALKLPARNFIRPILHDLRNLSITENRKERERFLKTNKQYQADSIQFYQDRNKRIAEFCIKVDALLSKYNNNFSGETDMITAIDIADKVFSYSTLGANGHYLLLNSDGLDSSNRKVSKLQNKADVILINAGRKMHTSVDAVVTMKLQSPEQAIQFTLNHQ